MAATYPLSIVAFTTKTNKVDIVDASHINRLQEEVVAEQTELGKDPAGSVVNLKTRLAVALADTGAIANGTAFPTSPTPINGQIFYRSDEDTLYVYDGTTWDAIAAGNIQIFTANGTFTAPGGVTKVYLSMCGGGSGSMSSIEGTASGGGGAGESLINYPYTVVAGNNYSVVIGAGGAAGADGGNTTFDTSVIALKGVSAVARPNGGVGGGQGMDGGNAVTTTPGAAGGFTKGGNGGTGSSVGDQAGGGGGGTVFGKGGIGAQAAPGIAAAANTGGGGGGAGSGGGGRAGAAGGSGICIVMF